MVEVTVSLSDEEYAELEAVAERETRSPELQARHMLRRSLRVEKSMVAPQGEIHIETNGTAIEATEAILEGFKSFPDIDEEASMRP